MNESIDANGIKLLGMLSLEWHWLFQVEADFLNTHCDVFMSNDSDVFIMSTFAQTKREKTFPC